MTKKKKDVEEDYTYSPDYSRYKNLYKKEKMEILALVGKGTYGGINITDSVVPSIDFIAYIDLKTGKLFTEVSRMYWIIPKRVGEKRMSTFPIYSKDNTIYHLLVRESKKDMIDCTKIKKRFLFVKVVDESNDETKFKEILEEYGKPVIIKEEGLGEFVLNKEHYFFEGTINWLGKDIPVYLDVDLNDKKTWEDSFNELKKITCNIKANDDEFRQIAAENLTEMANFWVEEGEEEITKDDFKKRISIDSFSVDHYGSLRVYYCDGGMFFGNLVAIERYRDIIESVHIERY